MKKLEELKSRLDKKLRVFMPSYESVARFHLSKTDINEKENCPVCLLDSRIDVKVKNVRLSDFGIGQIVPPNEMYIMISNFLSREKVIVDNRTDVQKIVSKGFDKTTSFRKAKQ